LALLALDTNFVLYSLSILWDVNDLFPFIKFIRYVYICESEILENIAQFIICIKKKKRERRKAAMY